VFDVGANRGDYTRLALQASPDGEVWAFEPVPAVFAQLQAAHGGDPRVHLLPLALAAHDGPLTLYADPRRSGHTTAVAGVQPGVHGLEEPECFERPAQRLDSFCAAAGITAIDLHGAAYRLGKLYPRGVLWFERYSSELDDLIGPNLVLALRSRPDLIAALSLGQQP
jgi:FkbM family methyltransferase